MWRLIFRHSTRSLLFASCLSHCAGHVKREVCCAFAPRATLLTWSVALEQHGPMCVRSLMEIQEMAWSLLKDRHRGMNLLWISRAAVEIRHLSYSVCYGIRFNEAACIDESIPTLDYSLSVASLIGHLAVRTPNLDSSVNPEGCVGLFEWASYCYSTSSVTCVRLIYLLTSWGKVLLEKLIGSQLVTKFSAFYGTRRFITLYTSARQLSVSWTVSIHCVPPIPPPEDPS